MKTPCRGLLFVLVAGLIGSAQLAAPADSAASAPLPSPVATADDWPQWRGTNRDGKAPDTGLIDSWPEGGPPLLWSTEGAGGGFSSVSVTGDKILTMGDIGESQYVIAFDRSNGDKLWQAEVGPWWNDGYGGPRGTPTVAGDLAYALGTEGDLVAVEIDSGDVRWRRNLPADFDGHEPLNGGGDYTWKYAESPLVDGNRVLVTPGGEDNVIVALDRMTGELIWETRIPAFGEAGNMGAGYSSIVISEAAGVKQYVQLMARGLVGLRAEDGELLWTYARISNEVANIPTPVVTGDYVLGATGYGAGAALLRLHPEGDGVRVEEVWFHDGNVMQNHHGGMILHEGTIYLGQGHNRGFPQAVDFESGEVLWGPERNAGTGSGAVMYADGHLYYRYQNGMMVLVEANPEQYVEKGSFEIPNPAEFSWAHPVIADGLLYLREQDAIHVYDLRAD